MGTEKVANPEVLRMKIFATSKPVARSRFWYFLSNLKRVKKANGEVLSTREIFEKNTNQVKNYGFWIRYDSRSGTHNMYKEYRDVSLNACVEKMYADMSSKHRVRKSSIQIVKTAVISAKACKRPNILQFHSSKIAFRMFHRVNRPSHKRFKTLYKAQRPTTFF